MKTLMIVVLLLLTSLTEAEYSRVYLDSHPLKIAQVNGIEIAYRTVGQGEGRPKVVVIMGLGGSNVAWGDTLIKGFYIIILYDSVRLIPRAILS